MVLDGHQGVQSLLSAREEKARIDLSSQLKSFQRVTACILQKDETVAVVIQMDTH